MPSPSIRPRFELLVDVPAAATLRLIEAQIGRSPTIRGWIAEPYAELRLPAQDRLMWSPRLALHVEDVPGGTHLVCRLQPEPDVWTAYMALWGALGVATIGVTIFGVAQWVVNGVPWVTLAGLPVVGVAGLLLFLAALVGQRRCAPQTEQLERELQAALAGHVGSSRSRTENSTTL